MKKYLVFVIQGYNSQEGEMLKDTVLIELIDKTADKAIARAKTIVQKQFYRIKDVIEKVC